MRYAVLIGIILIAAPLLLRYQSPEPFPDAASYEALRTSKLEYYDALYAKPHIPTPADWLFKYIPPQLLLVILATITLFALSIYYDSEAFILFFASTPVFLRTFTSVGEAAVGAALIAIGVTLIKYRQYYAVLLIPIAFWLSFGLGIIATIAFIAAALIEKMTFVSLGASFLALISGVTAAALNRSIDLGLTSISVPEALSLYGTPTGVTLFLAFLGLIGFIVMYSKNHNEELFVSLLIIPCALFFEHGMLLIAALLAVYASKAWTFLWNRTWNFDEVRTLTLVLIICGTLFTTIVIEKNLSQIDEARVEVTRFVRSAYPQGTSIAAGSDLAPILAYYGYPSSTPQLHENPGFIASSLQEQGYQYIATREQNPPYSHFPVIYQNKERGYTLYEVPMH